ncbi:MAG TPA: S24 family peptidase, partial [Humisphaera sp.]
PGADAVARTVPIVNKVSAGYPSDFTDLGYPPRVADEFITAPGVDDPDAFACRVHGDSMSPKYGPGDVVIFSPRAAFKDGADCFVRFEDGQTTFKRVYAETDAEGNEVLRLQPRNDRYRPQVVPRERVAGVYKAVSVYRGVDE